MTETIQQIPVLTALLALLLPAVVAGGLLGFARARFRVESDPVVERINDLLPQTQCAQCGYPGCRPYAEAIAAGDAINKCPPGGEQTIDALADLLGREPAALDPAYGAEEAPRVAFIREDECIGCAKCIPACPVDAIVGTARMMHTVIADECTGCELCVDPCPVDCIDLVPVAADPSPAFPAGDHAPCIRCALCEPACPVDLQPQQLYRFASAGEYDDARSWNLETCIECGLCDAACPSGIPLARYFRAAKADIRRRDRDHERAEHARHRYEFRQIRVEQERQIQERKRRERAELAQAGRAGGADPIQAALARARARQAEPASSRDRD